MEANPLGGPQSVPVEPGPDGWGRIKPGASGGATFQRIARSLGALLNFLLAAKKICHTIRQALN
jgi:hypothetical protein